MRVVTIGVVLIADGSSAPLHASLKGTSMASTDIGIDLGKYQLGWADEEDYVFKPKKGLNEDILREMSWMKGEPEWMRDFRLRSFEIFKKKSMPNWGGDMSEIYFDDIYYYIKPTDGQVNDWDDLPDAIKDTYEKLGIPEAERKYLAGVTAQYESEVVYHQIREDLEAQGVLFCDMDTAVKEYPQPGHPAERQQVLRFNSAAWSGGSFIYVPPGVEVEMPLRPTSASTRKTWPVRAHPDHRRRGLEGALHRGLLGPDLHL